MWFINLFFSLAMALAPAQAQEDGAAFDYNTVRADMFAGFAGDAARFAKAMEACERTLARQPKHPEALVWHGSGLFFQAGQAFQRGDMAIIDADARACSTLVPRLSLQTLVETRSSTPCRPGAKAAESLCARGNGTGASVSKLKTTAPASTRRAFPTGTGWRSSARAWR